ncbi:MAG: hypothetical protein QM724_05230 [Flavobacteriales bacterium]
MRSLRSLRTRWLQVMAALVLLLGPATPALARMTCVNSGHSVLNVGQARDCCPVDHTHSTPAVKAMCCELVQAQPQRSAFVASASPELPALEALPIGISLETPVLSLDEAVRLVPQARPPTLIGRRLAAIGLLRL